MWRVCPKERFWDTTPRPPPLLTILYTTTYFQQKLLLFIFIILGLDSAKTIYGPSTAAMTGSGAEFRV